MTPPSDSKRKPRRARLNARTADRHDLYQRSVQDPENDAAFLRKRFERLAGRRLRRFREDFCGTALLSCEMVRQRDDIEAIGVDLDRATLSWGRRHNRAKLTKGQRKRVELMQADVLDVGRPRVDLIAALNFSFNVFRSRGQLGSYIANSLRSLRPGGVLILDVWGGSESQDEREDYQVYDDFTYVWDLARFDPITYRATCKIHFEFEDGSKLRNAFVYKWRLWTLPELQELFEHAGFENVHVLWEQTGDDGRGSGVFKKVRRGDPTYSWVAFVIGQEPA